MALINPHPQQLKEPLFSGAIKLQLGKETSVIFDGIRPRYPQSSAVPPEQQKGENR